MTLLSASDAKAKGICINVSFMGGSCVETVGARANTHRTISKGTNGEIWDLRGITVSIGGS